MYKQLSDSIPIGYSVVRMGEYDTFYRVRVKIAVSARINGMAEEMPELDVSRINFPGFYMFVSPIHFNIDPPCVFAPRSEMSIAIHFIQNMENSLPYACLHPLADVEVVN